MSNKKRGRSLQRVMWPSSAWPTAPRQVAKVGRNDACPCGSGKKYKECHEREGEAFLEKLARQQAKTRLREVRRHLKAQGVPWYRRIFVRL
ncbi:MAG TPA: SEC-C metal-binding domain-containing protein [Thermoanaerobaculia bacterium]|jgi:hypothetical protein